MYTNPDTKRGTGESLWEEAYSVLRRRLLEGEYTFGRRLGEERLASELSMSRTPVREALAALKAEGLVKRHAGGGFEPAPPELDGVADLYEVRLVLEHEAIVRPLRHGTEHNRVVLEQLRAEWRALLPDPPAASAGFVAIDESFHVGIARAAGNAALSEHLQRVNERIRFVRMYDFLTVERIIQTIRQHVDIVEALLAYDFDTASARLKSHLEESLDVAKDRALRAFGRMVSWQFSTDTATPSARDLLTVPGGEDQ